MNLKKKIFFAYINIITVDEMRI